MRFKRKGQASEPESAASVSFLKKHLLMIVGGAAGILVTLYSS